MANDRFISLSPAAGTTALVFDFKIWAASGLTVRRTRAGLETLLVLTTDYTVAIAPVDDGGTVTLAVASLDGDRYDIAGLTPVERISDYDPSQTPSGNQIDADLNRVTAIEQELRREVDSHETRIGQAEIDVADHEGRIDQAEIDIDNLWDWTETNGNPRPIEYFGGIADGTTAGTGTDNADAFDAAHAWLKEEVAAGRNPVLSFKPGGVYLSNRPVNFTGLRSTIGKTLIEGRGAVIVGGAGCAAKCIIDALHSQRLIFNDLHWYGLEAFRPRFGLQYGRARMQGASTVRAQTAANVSFINATAAGHYARGPLYNNASELSYLVGCLFRNDATGGCPIEGVIVDGTEAISAGVYGGIMDAANVWNVQSDYVVVNQPVGATQSFNNQSWVNTSFIRPNGGDGLFVTVDIDRWRARNCYLVVKDGDGIVMYVHRRASSGALRRVSKDVDLDIHMESDTPELPELTFNNAFRFIPCDNNSGNPINIELSSFKFQDKNSHADEAIFRLSGLFPAGSRVIGTASLQLGGFQGSLDNPSGGWPSLGICYPPTAFRFAGSQIFPVKPTADTTENDFDVVGDISYLRASAEFFRAPMGSYRLQIANMDSLHYKGEHIFGGDKDAELTQSGFNPFPKQISLHKGEVIFSGGPKLLHGAGNPEGVETAPVNSLYIRSDGTNDTGLYVKTSGSGNTGWRDASILSASRTYADIATAAAASIPVVFSRVYTLAHASATGLGGAWYKRANAEPSHSLKFQDALAAWWEIDEDQIYAEIAGAIGDGSTICTTAFQAAIDAVAAVGGGVARFGIGTFLIDDTLVIPSNVTLEGVSETASILVIVSTMSVDDPAIANETPSTDGSLTDTGIVIRNFTMRNERIGVNWLSKADGTPITDPEADYLPGGCLAPTVQPQISLTVTDGAVTGVTVDMAGSGVNFPVAIWVSGDGEGAQLTGVISAGGLASVTISNGGRNYTTATAVVAGGGADPVTALYAADRRNPDRTDGSGVAIRLTTCNSPVIERVRFEDFGDLGVVQDRGCDNLVVQHCRFEDCGQIDFVGSCLWSGAYGTFGQGQPFFRFSTNTKFRFNTVRRHLRSVVTFGGKYQTFEGNHIEGWGESCVFIGTNGDNWTVQNNIASGGRLTDIVCQFVEGRGTGVVSGNKVSDCDGKGVYAGEDARIDILENWFTAIDASEKGATFPFGPFSERVGFSQGSVPIAGTQRRLVDNATISVAELKAGDSNRPRRCLIRGNRILDHDNGAYDWLVTFARGAANAIEGVSIIDNDLSAAANADLFEVDEAVDCLNLDKPFIVRDNIGRPDSHMLSNRSNFSRTDASGVQSIFSGPSVVTLWGKSRYRIEAEIIISCGTSSHDVALAFGVTAALSSIWYRVQNRNGALNSTGNNQSTSDADTVAATNFVAASVNGRHVAQVRGIIETDAETAITPQFALGGATGGSVSINAPSFMRFIYDGPAGRESVGDVS